MRILHLTRDFPPRACGGISTAVGGLVGASAGAGLDVAVVSFDAWRPTRAAVAAVPAPGDAGGIPVLRITAPSQLPAVHAFAAAWRPRLLHVHDGMLWPLAAALRAARALPAVQTVHVVQREMNARRGIAERTRSLAGQETALAEAERVIAPSRAAAAALAPYGDALAARLRVAPHGVADSPAARATAAARAAAPPAGPWLAVGRFDDVKGTATLFATLVSLLTARPSATALIAGGVPENARAERRWRRRWEAQAPADVRARVRLAGWLTADALETCWRSAGALLVASRFETFGLAAAEAMLRGVPVVATAAGALPELIADGETGLLVPPDDAGALLAGALALAESPALAARLGRAAAARIRDGRLCAQALPAVAAVYRELA